MSGKPETPERFSVARWSRRKLEAAAQASPPAVAPAAAAPAAPGAPASAVPELPSVESLTFDSDFTAFLRPEVDEKLRRAALKQLFRDPRFNVMDGLDVYIDDYTKADPIEPDVLTGLLQGFGNPPEPAGEPVGDSARAAPLPEVADQPRNADVASPGTESETSAAVRELGRSAAGPSEAGLAPEDEESAPR